jgi:hypothetical protein
MAALVCGLAVLVLVVGCRTWIPVPTGEMVRSHNREQLNKLSVGMSRAEVLEIMGTDAIQTYKKSALPSKKGSKEISKEVRALYRSERITNPFRTETSRTANGAQIEILLYYTDILEVDGAITDDELTPIVIEDGVLAGWGWVFLDQNAAGYNIELRR